MRFMLYSVNAEDYGKMEMRASGSLSSHAALRDSKMRSQASPRSYEIFTYMPGRKAAELCFSLIYLMGNETSPRQRSPTGLNFWPSSLCTPACDHLNYEEQVQE